MLRLTPAGFGDFKKEYECVRDMPEDENGFTNPWHGIARADFPEALRTMRDWSEGRGLPEGYVPETYFFLWDGDEIAGQFRLRHFLCPSLVNGAGHIGYWIRPEKRGMGCATEGLRLLLRVAASVVPEDEIYLRVNRDNPASLKVMLKNGGAVHHADEAKYYVRIPKPCQYLEGQEPDQG